MKRSQQGIFLGVVLSALLAVTIALVLNDERRRQLSHRLEALRNALPDGKQLKQSAQQIATKAQGARSNLGEQMQEMFSAAQQTATSFGTNLQTKSSDFVNALKDRR